jgi:hypothetical protein
MGGATEVAFPRQTTEFLSGKSRKMRFVPGQKTVCVGSLTHVACHPGATEVRFRRYWPKQATQEYA